MFPLLLALASTGGLDAARMDINRYCAGRSGCLLRQRKSLSAYERFAATYADPGDRVADACARRGKRGRYVDWAVAAACMRAAARGQAAGGPLVYRRG